jgi:hypothetical protein
MKRIFTIAAVASLATLAACGGKRNEGAATDTTGMPAADTAMAPPPAAPMDTGAMMPDTMKKDTGMMKGDTMKHDTGAMGQDTTKKM